MILKNEIPILEFDTDSQAVIEPSHENLDMRLPSRAVYAFLGDYIDIYAHSWGGNSYECALELCLDAVLKL